MPTPICTLAPQGHSKYIPQDIYRNLALGYIEFSGFQTTKTSVDKRLNIIIHNSLQNIGHYWIFLPEAIGIPPQYNPHKPLGLQRYNNYSE